MTADRDQRRRAREETNRSFIVEASAGTGKTSILIERILHCVLERGPDGAPIPLSRICAITFTEKAAGEMKIRLRQEFERRSVESGDAGERAREALADLEGAAISTFHSFAVSLLKERPVEAGLDPRFTTLDEVQGQLLFQEVWEAWLQGALEERNTQLESALRAGLGLDALRDIAGTIRAHAHTVRRLSLPAPPSEEEAGRQRAGLLEEGIDFRSKVRDPEDKLFVHLERALAWLQDPDSAEMPTKPGPAGAAGKWAGGKDTVDAVRTFVRGAADFARQYKLLPAQRTFHAAVRWIIDEFLPAWESRKRLKGALDFDDQLWCACQLLSDSRAAREEFQNRYAALLIDEFQDTDPVQWEIIRLLAARQDGAAQAGGRIAAGRLFIVGDPKQSIYRFRGADIETYSTVAGKDAMAELGLERLELTVNFRSVPGILGFVDDAFREVMKEAEGKLFQPGYLAFGGHGARAGKQAGPAVHFLGDRDEEGKPAGSGREFYEVEAGRIARLVLRMRSGSGWEVEDRDGPGWRAPGYRDIAILLPVLTHADGLEDALRKWGIPYVLEGGKFYYTRSEVSSAVTVLRAVANPNDAVALYGALRSIYFGLSDEDLLRARLEGISLDYRSDVPAGSPLHRPCGILRDLHLQRHERSASELLETLLMQTGAREVLAPRGIQSLANLNKLVRTLRALQQDTTFSEVVEIVGGMDEEGVAESESRIMEERSDAVRVLSIHRAKGLDFPVVIVSGLGFQRRSRPADLLADPHGTGIFALRAGAKESGLSTPGWDALVDADKEREDAELTRLLYVAMTRARDHLVLCTHTRGKLLPDGERYAPAAEKTRLQPLAAFLDRLGEREVPSARYVDVAELDGVEPSQPAETAIRVGEAAAVLRSRTDELRRLLEETPKSRRLRTAAAGGEERAGAEAGPSPARDRAVRMGIAYHEAMEAADLAGTADTDGLARDAGGRHKLDGAAIRDLGTMLRQSLASPLMERVRTSLRAGRRVLRELPYARPVGEGGVEIEEGTIDLLFEEDGGWVLVDYKTDQIPEGLSDVAPFFRNRYAAQMHAYVEALQQLGIAVRSTCLLLARAGESIDFTD